MRYHVLVCSAFVIALASSAAQAADRLAIGAQAPGFTLKDQNGKEQTLAGLLKGGNVALVFHRSANW